MRRPQAAVGSAVFLAVAPGIVAGVGPWLLTGWKMVDDWGVAVRAIGWVLVVVGGTLLVQAFARFVREGAGTPAPVAPTERLVVGGLYRHVRNPMYLAVAATIVGQALILGSRLLFGYAALFLAVVATFVRLYEEPTLLRRYGADYETYCAAVPAWLPRLRRGV